MNRLILLVTMAAGLTTAGCGKSDWHDFNSTEGKYSAQFPGKPEDKSVTYRPGPQVHAHMVELPKATFLVSFIDLPPGIQLDLKGAIQGMTSLVGGIGGKGVGKQRRAATGQAMTRRRIWRI